MQNISTHCIVIELCVAKEKKEEDEKMIKIKIFMFGFHKIFKG